MDMTTKKKDVVWIMFDNAASVTPLQGIFVDCLDEPTKDGKTFPVITLDVSGTKYKLSRWRVNVEGCVKHIGPDSDSWKGKLLELNISQNKREFVLTPLLENVSR